MTDAIKHINPPELGPPPAYSQVVEVTASRLIFISGQIALDKTGAIVGKDDFAAQAEQVFHNLAAALEGAGCTVANMVKMTVFICDMANAPEYRKAKERFFARVTPTGVAASTLVEVSKLARPEFMIEIEAIAAA